MRQVCDELITNERRAETVEKLWNNWQKYGDKKSLELLLKLMGEMNIKLDVDAEVHGSLEDALDEL